MKNVTIYTTPSCGWCRTTKDYFKEHNIQYNEINVAADAAARGEMIQKSGQMGVPVIDIEGEIVVGYNQPRLARLLEISEPA
ncbi:MAG: NrdH-redoxin [Candidatus Andersenbacteria bacterium]|nr:NrdH-redoxin [Candidatus Andersenbacteria bacterium]MBI3250936.1 NrdH-redoxin [Candidatus Andersenbacteria bacterium]